MKSAIVFGTRPEIIKLAPLIKKTKKNNTTLIYTGQHYDTELSKIFFEDLGIRKPDFNLSIVKKNSALQIGHIIISLVKILQKIKPDTLIVQGDTNSGLAGGIASLKSEIPVCHIEAGLRSYDWRMPEEHNRIEIDHLSEFLFAPTRFNQNTLIREKVHGNIYVTGNTVIDAINDYSKVSSKRSNLDLPNDFILLTLHRAENVDNQKTLTGIVNVLMKTREFFIFPIHPHTLKNLKKFGLYQKIKNSLNIKMIKSVGYFDAIELLKNCRFICTDSGGIQEEATAPVIRKKVLVLRKTTDRPEAVSSNLAILVGTDPKNILTAIKKSSKNPKIISKKSPYGVGNSSSKILRILEKSF